MFSHYSAAFLDSHPYRPGLKCTERPPIPNTNFLKVQVIFEHLEHRHHLCFCLKEIGLGSRETVFYS